MCIFYLNHKLDRIDYLGSGFLESALEAIAEVKKIEQKKLEFLAKSGNYACLAAPKSIISY